MKNRLGCSRSKARKKREKKKEADDTRKYLINWPFCKRLMSMVKVSSVEKQNLLIDPLIKATCMVFRALRWTYGAYDVCAKTLLHG